MKPFDLAQAKAGKPICTRDGRLAKFVAHEPSAKRDHQKVITLVDGQWYSHTEAGTTLSGPGLVDSPNDLMLADPPPRKVKQWLNVYPETFKDGGVRSNVGYGYSSRETAERYSSLDRIACVEVEFEIPGDA